MRILLEIEASHSAASDLNLHSLLQLYGSRLRGAVLAMLGRLISSKSPCRSLELEDTILSGSSARLQAIEAVTTYHPTAAPLSFANVSASELFGSNVFNKIGDEGAAAQAGFQVVDEDDRDRIAPRPGDRGYGRGGDEGLGDLQRRHPLFARVLSADRVHRREARQLPVARRRRRRARRVLRQDAHPG